jgi:hypothetical protein
MLRSIPALKALTQLCIWPALRLPEVVGPRSASAFLATVALRPPITGDSLGKLRRPPRVLSRHRLSATTVIEATRSSTESCPPGTGFLG